MFVSTRKVLRPGILAAALLLAGSLMAGPLPMPAGAATGMTHIRVLHAVPDAPAVDVYVNGKAAVKGLAFPKVTGFLTVPAATYHLQVFPTGAPYSATGGAINATAPFAAGKYYTVAAIGKLATIGAKIVNENILNGPGMASTTKAQVRFVHFAPNAPAVDIVAKGVGAIFPNTRFPMGATTQNNGYIAVPGGTYNLAVTPAGMRTTVVLSLPGVKFAAGHIYTVYAVGLLKGAGMQALGVALTDDMAAM